MLPLFTVVMSVYGGDKAEYFREAIGSIFNQTLLPDELIIVVDGPIGTSLEEVLSSIACEPSVRILRQEVNSGLGFSRNVAIELARNDMIAVMDADDIAVPDRFAFQMPLLLSRKADVIGGFIEEFDVTLGDTRRLRTVPTTHDAIAALGRWRQPFNHVTIAFWREAYRRAGGYRPIHGVEDWDMFHRMIINGVRFANIPHVFVHVRSGDSMFRRRKGLFYLRQEIHLFSRMLSSGYINPLQFTCNVVVRLATRLLPTPVLILVYKWGLRRRVERESGEGEDRDASAVG